MRREIVAQKQTALKRWKPAKCSLHWSTKGKRKDEKSRATNNQYTVPAYWFQIGLKTVGCASALHFQHICVLWGTVSADVDCGSIRCYVLTQIGSLEINKHCCIHPGSQQMFDICFFWLWQFRVSRNGSIHSECKRSTSINCCSFGYDIRNDCKLELLIQRQAHWSIEGKEQSERMIWSVMGDGLFSYFVGL